ncbi:MAG: putative protein N(5)-glutamine methyltransferase [Actinocrinis sp.]
MSTSVYSFEPSSFAAVVDRLRAAGCVFAEDEARLLTAEARTPGELHDMVGRRAAGLPLEQVLGWAQFCGLRVAIDPGVFVPRRRSVLLVREAVGLARQYVEPVSRGEDAASVPLVALDLCCGSGAIGAAFAATLAGTGEAEVELHASDVDPVAVACARRNLSGVGGRVYQGDLYRSLPGALRGRVDILIANVPYVPTDAVALLPPEARDHEPLVALDGGPDGLDVLRRVCAEAPGWLAPGGGLLTETSERQLSAAVAIATANGLIARVAVWEEMDATVVVATRPA